MKSLFIFVLTIVSLPCSAQWKYAGITLNQVTGYGVHDTNFFIGIDKGVFGLPTRPQTSPAHIYRSAHPTEGWVESDSGIDFSQGPISSFATFGFYFFAGSLPSFRSNDNGKHWTLNGGGHVFKDGIFIFSTGGDGIYRSMDSGNSWIKLSGLAVTNFAGVNSYIFASTKKAVWFSKNEGITWDSTKAPFGDVGFATMGSILFAANGAIFKTTDSGVSWNNVPVPHLVHAIISSGTYLFIGTDNGVYFSIDSGGTWKSAGYYTDVNGYPAPRVTSLGVFDTLLFADAISSYQYSTFQPTWYLAMRSIPEMVKDTGPADVVQVPPADDSIRIYPNPSLGTVTIMSGSTELLGVRVLNVLGSEVRVPGSGVRGVKTLDLSGLPAGTYYLEIETPSGLVVRKLVKE